MAGFKEGTGSDPFADEKEEADDDAGETHVDDGPNAAGDREETGGVAEKPLLPYIHRRDGVKDGRSQRPVFVRDGTETGVADVHDILEDRLDTDVYQTDVWEAVIEVGLENIDDVEAVLRSKRYGYDWG
jgi:hypothetical protein